MKINFQRLFYIAFCLLCFTALPAFASPGPTDALKPTLRDIMDVINDPAFSGTEHREDRREKIMSIAASGFNFGEMSKRVLGKTWRGLDQQQRGHFEELFTKLLENAYIGKLEDYSGQEILYKDERIKGKRAAVSTVVKDNGTAPLPVNYVMLEQSGGWQVYDINIEGVSLLRNYREQFKSILRKEKFEGLIKVLQEKNASFLEEES